MRKTTLTLLLLLFACAWSRATLPNALASGGSQGAPKGSTGSMDPAGASGTLWVGGASGYSSMAACYAAIPATGGTCYVVANYSETMAGSLALTKMFAGFEFTGPATINMGSNQITLASNIAGAFIKGPVLGTGGSPVSAVHFIYTGSGVAFDIGDASASSSGDAFENITIDTTGAANNSSVIGFRGRRLNMFEIADVVVSCASSQIGFVADGNGAFMGDALWRNIRPFNCSTGLQLINANANSIMGGAISAAHIGIDIQSGNGNFIVTDIENTPTGVNFANDPAVFGNRVFIYGQGNGTDFVFGAAANGNIADNIGAYPGATVTATDSGNNNSVVNPYKYKIDKNGNVFLSGNISEGRILASGAAPACSVTGAGNHASCKILGTSSDSFPYARITTGSGPSASGTLTVTFSSPLGALGICQALPSSISGKWNPRASVFQTSGSNTAPVFAWDNNGAILAASSNYDVVLRCAGQ
jgi:hypothetical protein